MSPAAWFAFIPSPSSGALHIGPLQLRAYGLMIALGVLAATALTNRRVVDRGVATPDDISAIALWAVPAGIVGARIYHAIHHRHDPRPADDIQHSDFEAVS